MITKPKFRKGQAVWVRGKINDPIDHNVEICGYPLFVDEKDIRPNVTRKQIEKWYLKHVGIGKTQNSFESLCELIGVK